MSDQKKKPKKKFVGLAAKAKRRKQVSESRLAQRTGKSAMDRKLENLFKELRKKGISKKRPDIDWKKLLPKLREFKLPKVKPLYKKDMEKYRDKYHQLLKDSGNKRTISVEDMNKELYNIKKKKGGKAKKMRTYKKGGKA